MIKQPITQTMAARQSVTVPEFIDHLRGATVTTVQWGAANHDEVRRRHWGYLGREIVTPWIDAAHCWDYEYPNGDIESSPWIYLHDPNGWLVHLFVDVVEEHGKIVDGATIRELLAAFTTIADESLLDRSLLSQ